ncbi:unnamed protein product [Coffea canephora]|uniref:Expansin-like B1 n=1 Tax=Coffea canephora TaxID=49390 RepID=A0A068UIP3_COFCA|nr:unnamed protein product [Coffea canephora]
MTFALNHCCIFLCILVLLPVTCYSGDVFLSARATFYGSAGALGTPSGACGFGEYGKTVNNGEVCGVSKLYQNGTGCGACYQVRCKHPQYCTEEGTTVVVTDFAIGHGTDFVLSFEAFVKLARTNMGRLLIALGVIDAEYKRVPCQYPGTNVKVKVHEKSRYPDYLAIVILYQGGESDITAVEIYEESSKKWKAMRRAFGAVWDISNPPKGALTFRFQASGSAGVKWVEPKKVIPSEWRAGIIIDTAVQLN